MPITERGRNLSGGQRQMVALARALLPRPRVLILDEPTSSMDSASESRFVQRLKHVLEQRPMTVVISTHRMGLLDLVDRVMAERAVATLARSLVRKALAIRQPVDRMWIKALATSMVQTPTCRCLTDPVATVA